MRILGIDPGSHHLGWGIIDVTGSQLTHVASGTLDAPAQELVERLVYLGCALEALVGEHQPKVASVETVFHARNSQSALILGHARGAILYCLGRLGLPIAAYTPGQIKQASTGRGAAQKHQVQAMVRMLLGHKAAMGLDTSDALAAAICHAQHSDRLDNRALAHRAKLTAHSSRT
jgi:crossover junction endodeoxyribonuclease RuvC